MNDKDLSNKEARGISRLLTGVIAVLIAFSGCGSEAIRGLDRKEHAQEG
jgi:hypothetical protein